MHTVRPFLFIAALDAAHSTPSAAQLATNMAPFGFHCFTYESVADLLEGISMHAPERGLVLLTGQQVLVRHALAFLRALHPNLPLLVECQLNDADQIVAAFEGGADMVLPVGSPESVWVAACSAALRRSAQTAQPAAVVKHDDTWVFSAAMSQLITPQGVKVDLSNQEKVLIELLVRAPGHSVSRKQLMSSVLTDDQAVADRASNHLGVIISRLRRKFQRTGVSLPISTVHSQGYRFTARVRQQADN